MTKQEQGIQIEIVSRLLLNDASALAGIFADAEIHISGKTITIRWANALLGTLSAPEREKLERTATAMLRRIQIPYVVMVSGAA